MNINWKVRAKNPVFWAQVAASIALPLVAGAGLTWEDMTSWQTLGQTLLSSLGNPVVVVAMLASLWAAVTDPTTAGLGDSEQALGYTEPKKKGE